MLTPTCPLNNVLVTIKNKFYDTVEFASGIKLYKDTGYHPEESAMLEATVVSIPRAVQERMDYAGMTLPMRPGDRILMRYDVVYSYIDQPDRDTPIYKNVLLYKGEEFWKVDIQKIFGIILGGDVFMINGYVLCDILYDDTRSTRIILPGNAKVPELFRPIPPADRLRVKHIGLPLFGHPPLSVAAGEDILATQGVAQRYEINDSIFYIIKQSHILAGANG